VELAGGATALRGVAAVVVTLADTDEIAPRDDTTLAGCVRMLT